MTIALDATYSLGRHLSGVGVYSRELIHALAAAHPDERFFCYYRPNRFLRSFRQSLPRNASRRLLHGEPSGDLFHALNQRVDRPGRRTVVTFHDLFVMTSEYSTREFRERFTGQARGAAERSDLIIAVSEFTASQVEVLLNVPRNRIRVVPHGVRVPVSAGHGPAPHPPETASAGHGPAPHMSASRMAGHGPAPQTSGKERMILFVGALQKRKNIARLVRAFEIACEELGNDWRLVLAGASDGYGADEELAAVDASPRRSQIQVTGYIDDAERERLLATASIFAFPSLDEGFGMPVLEAMAHGIPVVTSDRSAMPEVAGDAALLANPGDADAIAAQLVRLATNSELARTLTEAGKARASEFTWERTARLTWDVYQELL